MRQAAALICWLVFAGMAAAETYLVLPFSNLSKSTNLDWVGESMAEAVREALAAEGLLVLSRDDRQEAYRRLAIRPYAPMTKASALRIAESLDADDVVVGSYELLAPDGSAPAARGSLRVRAQIFNARKATRGPEYTELGALEDLARLQTHLAWQTLQFLLPKQAPTEEEFRRRTPVIRLDAIERYTRGLLAASPDQKMQLFSEATRLDPHHSAAFFQLGRLQYERKLYRVAAASLARVQTTDVHHREATFYLGLARHMIGDYAGAQQAFEFVAGSVPLNEVWNNLAAAQLRRNLPEALTNFQKALEGDPADPDYHFNVGLALYRQGKTEEAAASFRAALDRNPEDAQARLMLARCEEAPTLKRRRPAALDVVERLKQNYEESAYLQLKAVLEPKNKQ
jgi:tetratricopeptide (TPR) repeat protein